MIILSIVALLFFMYASVMPSEDVYRIIWAIVLSMTFFLQIGLIVLIARNHN